MQRYEGSVKKYRTIGRWQVQIELNELNCVFHLYVDQVWAIDSGDSVVLAGQLTNTGIINCYAYKHLTKQIEGWTDKPPIFPAGCLIPIVCFVSAAFAYLFGVFIGSQLGVIGVILPFLVGTGFFIVLISCVYSIFKSFRQRRIFKMIYKLIE